MDDLSSGMRKVCCATKDRAIILSENKLHIYLQGVEQRRATDNLYCKMFQPRYSAQTERSNFQANFDFSSTEDVLCSMVSPSKVCAMNVNSTLAKISLILNLESSLENVLLVEEVNRIGCNYHDAVLRLHRVVKFLDVIRKH